MRYTLHCAALGSSVLVGSLAMTTPASASVFYNLQAEINNVAGSGQPQDLCMGIAGGAQGSGSGSVRDFTPIIVWNCNGAPDQTWSRTQVSMYHPTLELFDTVPISSGAAGSDCLDSNNKDNWNVGYNAYASFCPMESAAYGQGDGLVGIVGSTPSDFVFSYVQDDLSGYPCYTIQNPASTLYLGVSNGNGGRAPPDHAAYIQPGYSIISWSRTGNDQLWCDHSSATQTFAVNPDYVILEVTYAPPGKSSWVKYGETTSVGSTVTTTTTTTDEVDFSKGVSLKPPMGAGLGGSATVTNTDSWGTTSTGETDLTMLLSTGEQILGQVDAIDHDFDEIWVEIHPTMIGMYTPAVDGLPSITDWQFGDPTGGIITSVYAGYLNKHITPWNNTILMQFESAGLHPDTDSALAQALLWADPFFNADGVHGIAPVPGGNKRFQPIPEFQNVTFSSESQNTLPYSIEQKAMNSSGTEDDYTVTVGATLDVNYGIALGDPTGGASAAKAVLSLDSSESYKWTWKHSTNTKDSTGTDTTDSVQIGMASAGYGGPGTLFFYEDSLFKTYAFSLVVGEPPSWEYDYGASQYNLNGVSIHRCPVGYVMVGANLNTNVFKCSPVADASAPIVADYDTPRSFATSPSNNPVTIHSCPFGSVMVGLHADLNILLCQQMPTKPTAMANAITTERVDDSTSNTLDAEAVQTIGYPMRACESDVYSQAMSGINTTTNTFNCAINPGFGLPN